MKMMSCSIDGKGIFDSDFCCLETRRVKITSSESLGEQGLAIARSQPSSIDSSQEPRGLESSVAVEDGGSRQICYY